ncbi:MAG TPA: GNAT family N-acetyltransferase [Anaerolineales bacterium]|nr:GNAT family N-acetyltransferase [Anaerolineales bacterium]
MDLIVRHYLPSDQPAVFEISAESAFFGEPVEAFLEDRQLYNDAFAKYYTEFETSLVWVAESPQGVIGFLLGCADTAIQLKRWRKYIVTTVLLNSISGKYKLGKRTTRFALGMLAGSVRREAPPVNLSEYPAHLQIDVKQGCRGMGIGRLLIEAYLEQLRELHVHGVHLETTSHNEQACHLYENIGFQQLDERVNRYWTHMLGFLVKNRSYGMKLD